MGYRVAVVGATGNVGREIIETLEERDFPVETLFPLASTRSIGQEVHFKDTSYRVGVLDTFDFEKVDLVLSSAGASVSETFAPKAIQAGALIIDNSSFFRMDPQVPLVVPEVNPLALGKVKEKNIVANPNCTTIQLAVALKPLDDAFHIDRIIVTTFQSTSGTGKKGMDELFTQTKGIYQNEPISKNRHVYPKQIAFNVIPCIDTFMENGETKEEWKIRMETQKILGKELSITANCARVPVFVGHGEYVNISFKNPVTEEAIREVLSEAEGLSLLDKRNEEGYVTPIEVSGEDNVFISRLRMDLSVPSGISFWCVADNVRKGAALNAVQIAETLIKMDLL